MVHLDADENIRTFTRCARSIVIWQHKIDAKAKRPHLQTMKRSFGLLIHADCAIAGAIKGALVFIWLQEGIGGRIRRRQMENRFRLNFYGCVRVFVANDLFHL